MSKKKFDVYIETTVEVEDRGEDDTEMRDEAISIVESRIASAPKFIGFELKVYDAEEVF